MRRLPLAILLPLALAACGGPPVPESGANPGSGPGFQDYQSYLRQHQAAANGLGPAATDPAAPAFSTQSLGAAIDAADAANGVAPLPGADAGVPLSALPGADAGSPLPAVPGAGAAAADAGMAVDSGMAADRPRGDAPAGIAPQSGEVAPGSAAISDEQDFSAVTARETIASDRDRIARNRAQYQVIAPTDLPQRSGEAAPNIVQFALSTTHDVGTKMYRRSSLRLNSVNAACARFTSPDQAQEAFLAAGGPERDRKGIDPDGDGFACAWDPRPFRAALH